MAELTATLTPADRNDAIQVRRKASESADLTGATILEGLTTGVNAAAGISDKIGIGIVNQYTKEQSKLQAALKQTGDYNGFIMKTAANRTKYVTANPELLEEFADVDRNLLGFNPTVKTAEALELARTASLEADAAFAQGVQQVVNEVDGRTLEEATAIYRQRIQNDEQVAQNNLIISNLNASLAQGNKDPRIVQQIEDTVWKNYQLSNPETAIQLVGSDGQPTQAGMRVARSWQETQTELEVIKAQSLINKANAESTQTARESQVTLNKETERVYQLQSERAADKIVGLTTRVLDDRLIAIEAGVRKLAIEPESEDLAVTLANLEAERQETKTNLERTLSEAEIPSKYSEGSVERGMKQIDRQFDSMKTLLETPSKQRERIMTLMEQNLNITSMTDKLGVLHLMKKAGFNVGQAIMGTNDPELMKSLITAAKEGFQSIDPSDSEFGSVMDIAHRLQDQGVFTFFSEADESTKQKAVELQARTFDVVMSKDSYTDMDEQDLLTSSETMLIAASGSNDISSMDAVNTRIGTDQFKEKFLQSFPEPSKDGRDNGIADMARRVGVNTMTRVAIETQQLLIEDDNAQNVGATLEFDVSTNKFYVKPITQTSRIKSRVRTGRTDLDVRIQNKVGELNRALKSITNFSEYDHAVPMDLTRKQYGNLMVAGLRGITISNGTLDIPKGPDNVDIVPEHLKSKVEEASNLHSTISEHIQTIAPKFVISYNEDGSFEVNPAGE